jgi:hypothetical protein
MALRTNAAPTMLPIVHPKNANVRASSIGSPLSTRMSHLGWKGSVNAWLFLRLPTAHT